MSVADTDSLRRRRGDTSGNVSLVGRMHMLFKTRKPKKLRVGAGERAFFGLLDHDTFDLIKSGLLFSLEMFRVIMACLLALFVPQDCSGGVGPPQLCDLNQNLTGLTSFNTFVLAWNFITLFMSVIHYLLVFRREKFLIEYLDEDDNMGEKALPTQLPRYPDIDRDLIAVNSQVLMSASLTLIAFVINVIVSGVLVFRDYYYGYQTATVFATNIGLITTVLQKALAHAWAGLQQKIALSCIEYEPVSYNTIDANYRDDSETPAPVEDYGAMLNSGAQVVPTPTTGSDVAHIQAGMQ